jgi:acyl carrier protein
VSQDIQDRVRVVFEFLTTNPAPERKVEDLGLDSLDFLTLIQDLEKEFGVQIGAEEMAACVTVGDVIALVESKCLVSN